MSPARRAAAFPLDSLPAKPLDAVLVRCVPQLSFDSGDPPSYFFVSGHARRLNPSGVECLYFGGDEATAGAEYDRNAAGTTAGNQPKIIFKVRAHLHGVVDLGDAYVRKHLKIRNIDLFGFWRGKRETRYVPGFPGARSQGETLEELNENLKEVVQMLLEDGEPELCRA